MPTDCPTIVTEKKGTIPRVSEDFQINRRLISVFASLLCFAIFGPARLSAQSQNAATSQPLNSSVADFGTSFTFSPPVACPGCIETELGFLSLQDGRYIPLVVTAALPGGRTDLSVFVNLLDSQIAQSRRAAHFGNRFDFVLRQKVLEKRGFELTLAPRGSAYVRGVDGCRVGAVAGPQYTWGKNLAVADFSWTAGVGVSAANPRSDYLTSFDYNRTLDQRGSGFFWGAQQELSAGHQTVGIEQGVVIPFRNGQVELAMEQLDLNTNPAWQFQALWIVNWGKVLGRR